MAFLGGLSGLGALAGGVEQGIGQGLNLNQYLQQQQAQNLAGNALMAYGGGQPSTGGGGILGGLSNIVGGMFGGGQQSQTPMPPQIGAGQTPISSPTPGLQAGPGVANANNPFTAPATSDPNSPFARQDPNLGQPQQPSAPPMQSPQAQPAQPFDASQRAMGGLGQQQLSPFQAIQLMRRVAPNANGGQIYRGLAALAQGQMVGYGAITPYQALELQRQNILNEAQIANWNDEARHRHAMEDKGVKTEARQAAYQQMEVANRSVTALETQLRDATNDLDKIRALPNPTDEDNARATALTAKIKTLQVQRDRAQRIYDAAERQYEGGADSAGGGSGEAERTQDIANARQYLQNGADKNKVIQILKGKYDNFDPAELE